MQYQLFQWLLLENRDMKYFKYFSANLGQPFYMKVKYWSIYQKDYYTGNLKLAKSFKEEGKITLVNDSYIIKFVNLFFF